MPTPPTPSLTTNPGACPSMPPPPLPPPLPPPATTAASLPANPLFDQVTKRNTESFTAHAATKAAQCHAHGALPDPDCTPGVIMDISLDRICHEPTSVRRNVPNEVKKQVYAEYGYTSPQPAGKFEVDHFIPLALGGDNAVANLWPQPAKPVPGFHEKDRVELYLHNKVCSGEMTLAKARELITGNWVTVWDQINAGAGDDGEDAN